MPSLCQSFRENAWRKDLCSNCFKSKAEHGQGNAVEGNHTVDDLDWNTYQQTTYHRHWDVKPSVTMSTESDVCVKDKGILRKTTLTTMSVRTKRNVVFKAEEIEIIGFGGDDSSDMEDLTVSSSSVQDESEDESTLSEIEKECLNITRKNTLFNSANRNLLGETVKAFTTHGMSTESNSSKSLNTGPKTPLVVIRPFGQPNSMPNIFNRVNNPVLPKEKEQLNPKPTTTLVPATVINITTTTPTLSSSPIKCSSSPLSPDLPAIIKETIPPVVTSDEIPPALPTTPPPALEVAKSVFLQQVLEEECPKAKITRKPPILKEKPKIFIKINRSENSTADSDQESGIDSPSSPSPQEMIELEEHQENDRKSPSPEPIRMKQEEKVQSVQILCSRGKSAAPAPPPLDSPVSQVQEEVPSQEKSALKRLDSLFALDTTPNPSQERSILPLTKTKSAPPIPGGVLLSSTAPTPPQRQKVARSPSFKPTSATLDFHTVVGAKQEGSLTLEREFPTVVPSTPKFTTPVSNVNGKDAVPDPTSNSVSSSKLSFESARASIAESLAFHRIQTRASSGKRQAPLPPKEDANVNSNEMRHANEVNDAVEKTESFLEAVTFVNEEPLSSTTPNAKEINSEIVLLTQEKIHEKDFSKTPAQEVSITIPLRPPSVTGLYSSFQGNNGSKREVGSTVSLDTVLSPHSITYAPDCSHNNWTMNDDRQPRSLSLTRVEEDLSSGSMTSNSKSHVSVKSMLKQKANSFFASTPVSSNKTSTHEHSANGRVSRVDWHGKDKKDAKAKGNKFFLRRWFKLGSSSNSGNDSQEESKTHVPKTRPTILHPLDFHVGGVQVVTDMKQITTGQHPLITYAADPNPNSVSFDCSQSFSSDSSCETNSSRLITAELSLESTTSPDNSLQWQDLGTNSSGRPKPPPPPRVYSLETCKPSRPPPPNLPAKTTVYANLGEVRNGLTPKKPERSASMRIQSDIKENNYEHVIPKAERNPVGKEHVTHDGYIIPGSTRTKSARLRPGPHRHTLVSFIPPIKKDEDSPKSLTSLEDSYGAVTETNRMALVQILDQNTKSHASETQYFSLKESGLRWSDFNSIRVVAEEESYIWVESVYESLPVSLCIRTEDNEEKLPPFDFLFRPITQFEDYAPANIRSHGFGFVDVFPRLNLVKLEDIQPNPSRQACELALLQVLYLWEWAEKERMIVDPDRIRFSADKTGEYRAIWYGYGQMDYESAQNSNFATFLHKLRGRFDVVDQLPVNLGLEPCKNALEFLLFGPYERQDIDSLEGFQRWINLNRAQTLHEFIRSRGLGLIELKLGEELRLAFLLRASPTILLQSHNILRNLL